MDEIQRVLILMDIEDFFKHITGHDHNEQKKVKVADITEEEKRRFAELLARGLAMDKGYKRAKSKLMSDRNRLWADMCDKYNLHGRSLSQDDDSIFEYVCDE